jgi:hypothetical protein
MAGKHFLHSVSRSSKSVAVHSFLFLGPIPSQPPLPVSLHHHKLNVGISLQSVLEILLIPIYSYSPGNLINLMMLNDTHTYADTEMIPKSNPCVSPEFYIQISNTCLLFSWLPNRHCKSTFSNLSSHYLLQLEFLL